jgi:hypothetical protein
MKSALLQIKYTGFTVHICARRDGDFKHWIPDTGDYEKNLFFTYLYRGEMREHRADNNELSGVVTGETYVNTNVHLTYPTIEYYVGDSVWLCFSSYQPFVAEYKRLKGDIVVPPNTGVYNILGMFTFEEADVKALYYIAPRDYEYTISGDAKLAFIKLGDFVNRPKKLLY